MRMKIYDTWSNLNKLHYYHMKKCQIVPSSLSLHFNCSDALQSYALFSVIHVPFDSIIHTPDFLFNLIQIVFSLPFRLFCICIMSDVSRRYPLSAHLPPRYVAVSRIKQSSCDAPVYAPSQNRNEYNIFPHQAITPIYPVTPDLHHVSPATLNSDPSRYPLRLSRPKISPSWGSDGLDRDSVIVGREFRGIPAQNGKLDKYQFEGSYHHELM